MQPISRTKADYCFNYARFRPHGRLEGLGQTTLYLSARNRFRSWLFDSLCLLSNIEHAIDNWSSDNRSGRTRVLGIGDYRRATFFIEQEAKRSREPRLEFLPIIKTGNSVRVRIKNIGGSVAVDCYGKLTLEHTENDFAFGSGTGTHTRINARSGGTVRNADICWAFGDYPAEANIKKGEEKSLEVFQLIVEGFTPTRFEIPSEGGYTETIGEINPEIIVRSQAFLNPKTYKGKLVVGGSDTSPIETDIEIGISKDNSPYLIFL